MASTRIIFASHPENIKRKVDIMDPCTSPASGPRKRQRLTHLTPEEKMLRRKLKNRVAAQTARDRKKAHMDTIEETLEISHINNHKLLKENEALKQKNAILMNENQELRRRLGLVADVKMETKKEDVLITKKEVGSPESAAGADPTDFSVVSCSSLLESDMLLGLLENLETQTQATSDIISQDTCNADQAQVSPCPVVGPSAEELESLKELIRFDHEYVKRPPTPTPIIDIKHEKTIYSVVTGSNGETPVIEIDMDDSIIDLDADDSDMKFRTDVLPSKAGAVLQDMLVSLKDVPLSIDTNNTSVPNLLSINEGIFNCDISELLFLDSEVGNCDVKSDAGRSEYSSSVDSAFGDTPASPFSDTDMSPNLGDSIWEESFTDLFPSLDYL